MCGLRKINVGGSDPLRGAWCQVWWSGKTWVDSRDVSKTSQEYMSSCDAGWDRVKYLRSSLGSGWMTGEPVIEIRKFQGETTLGEDARCDLFNLSMSTACNNYPQVRIEIRKTFI